MTLLIPSWDGFDCYPSDSSARKVAHTAAPQDGVGFQVSRFPRSGKLDDGEPTCQIDKFETLGGGRGEGGEGKRNCLSEISDHSRIPVFLETWTTPNTTCHGHQSRNCDFETELQTRGRLATCLIDKFKTLTAFKPLGDVDVRGRAPSRPENKQQGKTRLIAKLPDCHFARISSPRPKPQLDQTTHKGWQPDGRTPSGGYRPDRYPEPQIDSEKDPSASISKKNTSRSPESGSPS